jgi:hypothetical protein
MTIVSHHRLQYQLSCLYVGVDIFIKKLSRNVEETTERFFTRVLSHEYNRHLLTYNMSRTVVSFVLCSIFAFSQHRSIENVKFSPETLQLDSHRQVYSFNRSYIRLPEFE